MLPIEAIAALSKVTAPVVLERRRQARSHIEEKAVEDLELLPILAPSTTSSRLFAFAKETLDFVGSFFALLLLSPLLVCIAVLIKLTSKGPVLFIQQRVGKGGQTFSMLKFRTMVVNAEAQLEALRAQNELAGPMFKIKRDPRITKFGSFLRRHSLDELPQLWNVLRGDMSLVGPRPSLPAEVKQFKRWQARRLSIKPGLTCIWQVSGRNTIPFEEWMRMDLRYVDNKSLGMDLKLILTTFKVFTDSHGAS